MNTLLKTFPICRAVIMNAVRMNSTHCGKAAWTPSKSVLIWHMLLLLAVQFHCIVFVPRVIITVLELEGTLKPLSSSPLYKWPWLSQLGFVPLVYGPNWRPLWPLEGRKSQALWRPTGCSRLAAVWCCELPSFFGSHCPRSAR